MYKVNVAKQEGLNQKRLIWTLKTKGDLWFDGLYFSVAYEFQPNRISWHITIDILYDFTK